MFTGLVSAVARVVSLRSGAAGAVLAVERPPAFGDAAVGESIAVSGVCLTVVPPAARGQALFFDVSPETLSRSALGDLAVGAGVNLERALAAGDRLGGHIVAGHVDGTTEVLAVEKSGDSWTFRFSLPAPLARYTVEKGSIAVDGISATTLGERKAGDRVNLEVDVLGKYVERLLAARLGETREAVEAQGARDERLRGLLTEGA
jgi:riboflavin synthase